MEKSGKKIDYSLCYLRITATLAVIILHACTTVTDNRDLFGGSGSQILFLDIIASLMRWAVPVFFMITGALLLDNAKVITYGTVIRKYCLRIVWVLLLFGLPFAALKNYSGAKGILELCAKSVLAVFTNGGFSHFWYLYVLIGLYLILPVLKAFVASSEGSLNVEILTLILFIFCSIIPYISKVCDLKTAFTIPLTYAVMYLFLGFLMRKYAEGIPVDIPLLLALLSMAVIVLAILITGNTVVAEYQSPVTMILAVSVFVFFQKACRKPSDIAWKIDRMSFCVYIIHPVFIHVVYRLAHVTPLLLEGGLVVPAVIVFALGFAVISYIGAFVMLLIRPLKEHVL